MGLSLQQWLKLISAAPQLVAEVRAVLPVVVPVIKRIMALVEDLDLDKSPPAPEHVVPPREIVEQAHGLTAEEKDLFDRIKIE